MQSAELGSDDVNISIEYIWIENLQIIFWCGQFCCLDTLSSSVLAVEQ
jgi:hypothetical protein